MNLFFQQCQRYCLQLAFETSCGCFHPIYLDQDKQKNYLNKTYGACNVTSGSDDYQCVRKVNKSSEFLKKQ